MDESDVARSAEALGLGRLLKEHPAACKAAMQSASDLRKSLPNDLSPADESAHVFRVTTTAEVRR